jgi:hypothetical protein
MPSLARFFRSHPGCLFAVRLCTFGVTMPLLAWYSVEMGKIPGRGGGIERAVHPEMFWITVALIIGGALFVTLVSTIIFFKKMRLIPRNWKLLGMDVRF